MPISSEQHAQQPRQIISNFKKYHKNQPVRKILPKIYVTKFAKQYLEFCLFVYLFILHKYDRNRSVISTISLSTLKKTTGKNDSTKTTRNPKEEH